ncbi:hypothetical protein [Pontibacter mangrovi]|uniref:Uncharacterized protein n=1 Tax=Pontibacter mangrovi TaxID=2589816 RepID=A0A501W1U2_9BACT|nr:hypothetical protein [Pontibacter mangrovi]TPE43589.1 hypothetical protein FJM65_12600 [Pontibacter mangrovi]
MENKLNRSHETPEEEAARIAQRKAESKAYNERILSEVDNEELGLTVRDVLDYIVHELKKLDWYRDGEKEEYTNITYFLTEENYYGYFVLLFHDINEDGEEDYNTDDTPYYWYYEREDEATALKVNYSGYPSIIPFNPKTKMKGRQALNDIVIDLSYRKQRIESKRKLNNLLSDELMTEE